MTLAFPTAQPVHRRAHDKPVVCIDCRYIRERPSGIGALVSALVNGVPPRAPDLEFLLLKHPLGPRVLSTSPNVRELVVPYEANGPVTLLALPRVVDLEKVSLFHATYNILPRDLHVPTVVTVHDLMWLHHPEWARSDGIWGRIETAFYRNGIRRALARGSRLVAVSRATANDIVSLRPDAKARTVVIAPGVPDLFDHDSSDDLARDRAEPRDGSEPHPILDGTRRYVLVVGQHAPYKNHEAALRAFAKAFPNSRSTSPHEGDSEHPKSDDVAIVFVHRLGNGPRVLMPIARELGVGERVHFFSALPAQTLDKLYRNAIALCHPSLYEGFGLPVVEAMARGCPVVASNRGALREVAGKAAEIVDPNDVDDIARALHRISQDPILAANLRRAGLRRAATLSWTSYVNHHVALYREMLGLDEPMSGVRLRP